MLSPYDIATIRVLVARELKRFFRQKSRIAGAIAQPLLFWIILGAGFGNSFQIAGAGNVKYLEYFFPGVVSMMALFTAIFSTMTLIEDRGAGFLQGVMAGPGSRLSMVAGKILGGVSVALIQTFLFVLLAPLAGFPLLEIAWMKLAVILFLMSFTLTSFGFFLAWWLNSVPGYHAVMSVLLLPMWLLSGSTFPVRTQSTVLNAIIVFNPMTYYLEGIRTALYGKKFPYEIVTSQSFSEQLVICCIFAVVAFGLAVLISRKSRV